MKNSYLIALAIIYFACGQKQQKTETTDYSVSTPTLTQLWASDTTVRTPESVLFDKSNNVLYIACINGVPPTEKDGDGYIAKLNPVDGSILDSAWITELDAPKGMGLIANRLYVANIDEVWVIDINSGETLEKIGIEGAQFLNDITTEPEGNVYVSDTQTGKIHLLSPNGEVSTWLENEKLVRPNGLYFNGDKMMLANSGDGIFHAINMTDKSMSAVTDSIFSGDGVVKVGDDFIVSSWKGEIYYVTAEKKTKLLDTSADGKNTADIEFDEETMTLFVPTFFGNQVVAYSLGY